jgi:hypothetical protein
MVRVGYVEKKKNFFYGFPICIGVAFIHLVLSGLRADMRPSLIFQSLRTGRIGLQYMTTRYFNRITRMLIFI